MLRKLFAVWVVLCLSGFETECSEYTKISTSERRRSAPMEYYREDDMGYNKRSDDYPMQNVYREEAAPQSKKTYNMSLNAFARAIRYHLFARNQDVRIVPGYQWFKHYDYNRDLVMLVHGIPTYHNYVDDYFATLSAALLNESNYNVVGVDWRDYFLPDVHHDDFLASHVYNTKLLGHLLYAILSRTGYHHPRTYFIGQDVGVVPAVVMAEKYNTLFNYVYGLDLARDRVHSWDALHSNYRLTREHGDVVAVLNYDETPYTYSHRNFFVVPRDGPAPASYRILAEAIMRGTLWGRHCSSSLNFKLGYCDELEEAPIWFTHVPEQDLRYVSGKYYLYPDFPLYGTC